MPSLCPLCARAMCDHTPEERDQSFEEMMRDLTPEELEAYRANQTGSPVMLALADRNRHLPDTPEAPMAMAERIGRARVDFRDEEVLGGSRQCDDSLDHRVHVRPNTAAAHRAPWAVAARASSTARQNRS